MKNKFTGLILQKGDVITLRPNSFDESIKELKPLSKLKSNGQKFSIAQNGDDIIGIVLDHTKNTYSFKDIIHIIYMYLFKKAKEEYIKIEIV